MTALRRAAVWVLAIALPWAALIITARAITAWATYLLG